MLRPLSAFNLVSLKVQRKVLRKEAILKIALSMLAKGFDHAIVIQLTGLSEEELAQIHH
ncbi:hypothetical protein [Serratia fonticola]|uniref:hypothetical protein n=1 Tax=Serratia fonticola TaxID=47917 RepID=UPI0021ADEA39|nr:hypothetical protein [Serratia fonticola]